jgi:hypothetical protein
MEPATHEIGLPEIEHVEDKGHRDKTRQREQPWARRPPRPRHGVGELRRHPPRHGVEKRQACVERDLAEISGYREQDRRQRRIDEFEGNAGVEIPAPQHLLAGPEPERIVLCLSAAPNLGNEHVGRQRDAADQKQNIERRSQRRISQHTRLSGKSEGDHVAAMNEGS